MRYNILQEHNHRIRRLHFTSMVKLPAVIIEVVRDSSDIFARFQDVRRGDDRAILRLVKRPRAARVRRGPRLSKQAFDEGNHGAFG